MATPKAPQQERSIRRVQAILDTAATVISRDGVDGLSMHTVVKASASSPGSVYQFFPGKPALIAALLQRYETELSDLAKNTATWLTDVRPSSIGAASVGFLHPFVAYYRRNPAYLSLILAQHRAAAPSDPVVAKALARVLELYAPDNPRIKTAAALMIEVGHAAVSAAPNGAKAADWQKEVECMLRTYVETLLNLPDRLLENG